MSNERSFIMVKPDGVHRHVVGEIIKRFEQRGYKLVAIKMLQVSITWISTANIVTKAMACTCSCSCCFIFLFKAPESLLKEHYGELSSKPFFPKLVQYMASGPVVPMVGIIRCFSICQLYRDFAHNFFSLWHFKLRYLIKAISSRTWCPLIKINAEEWQLTICI